MAIYAYTVGSRYIQPARTATDAVNPLRAYSVNHRKKLGRAWPRNTDHPGSNTSLAVLTFTKCSFSSKAKSWDSRQDQRYGEAVDGFVSGPPPHHDSRGRSSLKVASRPRRNKTSAVPYRGAAHVPTNTRTICPLALSQAACQAQALSPRMASLCRCGETLRFDRPG